MMISFRYFGYFAPIIVEHCVWLISYQYGEGEFELFNQEYPTAGKERILEEIHREDGAFPTSDAVESLSFLK